MNSSQSIKFQKTSAGTYTSGRWSIVRTYKWELRLDDCEVMGFTSLTAAKAGAAEYAAAMLVDLDVA